MSYPRYQFKVVYEYDAWSHLVRVKNAEPNGVTYWESNTSDAAGHVIDEQYGNGVMTTHVYDPRSGLVQEITSSNTAAVAVQALTYDWDTAGNLTERRDERVALTEHFNYDDLNRLDNSTLTTPVTGTFTNLDLSYDAAGNIATKSGTGTYTYNSTRRHALTTLTREDSSTDTFTYDANGNFISSTAGKTVTWTSYNYPRRTAEGTNAVDFFYGPDRQRYKEEIYSGSTLQSRRITVNGYFERVTESGATTDKHYIHAGSKVIAIHDRKSDFLHETHYLHRDHLGSVDTITDDDGNVTVPRMSFDAFGLRRNALDWTDGFPTNTELEQIRDITTRGYTGHQMIDAVKLVHMNGRVYDPTLGRFLSPDPNVFEPGNTQGFNRYAYVNNNPLSFTDPSGFMAKQEEPEEPEPSNRAQFEEEKCRRAGYDDCGTGTDVQGQERGGRVRSEVSTQVEMQPASPADNSNNTDTDSTDGNSTDSENWAQSYGPYDTTMCHESMTGCSEDLAFEGLRRMPGPGGNGERIEHYGESDLFVGRTAHFVDEASKTIYNVTMEGHLLGPGVVTRQVLTDSNGWIIIRTQKSGNAGILGFLSKLPARSLWRDVDLRIQKWMYYQNHAR